MRDDLTARTSGGSEPQPPTTRRRMVMNTVAEKSFTLHGRLMARLPQRGDDRGDVPGWVLVTLMTAGLVLTLWAVAGPRLEEVFNDAMDRVVGGP